MDNWLVVGSGGREYAIAQCLAKSDNHHVYVAPGNVMMNQINGVSCIDIDEMNFKSLVTFAQDNDILCTVVGPEEPLSDGIVDYFQKSGLRIFGPNRYAAKLESSKAFAKQIMQTANVPTAAYQEFHNINDALSYVNGHSMPVVIKANGLAGGKGVIIAKNEYDAKNAIKELFKLPHQNEILIEDFLTGEEFSYMLMVNGEKIIPMPLAQDHKRLLNADKGPNTGGMGAYSPLPQFSSNILKEATNTIIKPVLKEMNDSNHPFVGFLYAGLINTEDGIKVIEFNVRMGDPEAQVILPQLQSDLGNTIIKLLNNEKTITSWKKDKYYLGTVLAAKGYPKNPIDHLPIPVFNNKVQVIYAGIQKDKDEIYSHGGRVLMVVNSSDNLKLAQSQINLSLNTDLINKNYLYRTDIGNKAIKN
ncbi:phosphoribosylamine--glycine ligase [Apilactobacillus quenuiae]|uniref:phosphoribosylamine--glycine ligase n=1 Tax=Apilactobacillus quenuiae TaxID=2008377 RepID=UPI000D01B7CB|nr:phosphoribosylamine--glycine ligase [Apilactobacillus quenuiae]